MYRNKILVIATVLIALLLGVMIWSANVVADHQAKQKDDNVIGVELPKEQLPPPVPSGPAETPDDEVAAEPEESAEEEDITPESKLIIDTSEIVPTIAKRDTQKYVGRNYIDQVDFSKDLILWNTSTFPLHVYIENEDKLPEAFTQGIKSAFRNWQQSSDEFVTFEYVSDPEAAEITVSAPENAPEGCPGENGIEYKLDTKGTRLLGASLTVPQTDCSGNAVNVRTLYTLLLHPIGHILGINAHSPSSSDVMYPEVSYENQLISSIDITTLKLLYNVVPSSTNKLYTNTEMRKMIKRSDLKDKSYKEIMAVFNNHINSGEKDPFETTLSEAYDYYQNSSYSKAKKSYLAALPNAKSDYDKAYVNSSLAIICIKLQEYPEALNYANIAADLSNTPKNKYISAYINFISGNNYEAQDKLEALLARYPKFKAAYAILAQIYEKQGNTRKLDALVQQAKGHFFDNTPLYYKE